MKDVSVVNWWISLHTRTHPLYSLNSVAGFERCLGSLVCGENADSNSNLECSIPCRPLVVNRETVSCHFSLLSQGSPVE